MNWRVKQILEDLAVFVIGGGSAILIFLALMIVLLILFGSPETWETMFDNQFQEVIKMKEEKLTIFEKIMMGVFATFIIGTAVLIHIAPGQL